MTVLATPAFLGALAVLALNDHVLKGEWPGLVTGKLSDFAGVALVTIVAAVVVGRRLAIAATGIGFVALKAFPGVNVLVAPLLGGVTVADPTDLVALLILWPVYLWLGRAVPRAAEKPPLRKDHVLGLRNLLAWSALAVAVLATSATSCGSAGVNALAVDNGRLYAGIETPTGAEALTTEWFASSDGGDTWTPVADPPSDSAAFGGTESCDQSGTCWRVEPPDGVRHCEQGEPCTMPVSADDLDLPRDSCSQLGGDWFNSVLVLGNDTVLVAMGDQGVLVGGNRTWDLHSVLDEPEHEPPMPYALPLTLLVIGPRCFSSGLRCFIDHGKAPHARR